MNTEWGIMYCVTMYTADAGTMGKCLQIAGEAIYYVLIFSFEFYSS